MQCKHNGCRANAMRTGWCFWHDPNHKEERKKACSKGGRSGLVIEDIAIDTIADVKKVLVETINNVRTKEAYATRARVIGYLCSILHEVILDSELEERINKLEEQLVSNEKNERRW